jgi:hypothetical protein
MGQYKHESIGTIIYLRSLEFFYYQVIRQMWKYLNRRSQRKSHNWVGFNQVLDQFGMVKPVLAT